MYQIAAIVGFGRGEALGLTRQRQEGGGVRPARGARAARPRSRETGLGARRRTWAVAELFQPTVCQRLARGTARLPRLWRGSSLPRMLPSWRGSPAARSARRPVRPAAWTSSPGSAEANNVGPEAPRRSLPAGHPWRGTPGRWTSGRPRGIGHAGPARPVPPVTERRVCGAAPAFSGGDRQSVPRRPETL